MILSSPLLIHIHTLVKQGMMRNDSSAHIHKYTVIPIFVLIQYLTHIVNPTVVDGYGHQ